MFRYLFLYYIRNIVRRKLVSIINITGLAFGIAFVILIGQFLYFELNHNTTINNVDNIYRLVDGDSKDYNVDYSVKDKILGIVPGIKNVCLLNHFGVDVEAENKFFRIKHMVVVDSNFFNVFDLAFLNGNSNEAMNSVENVVLTETSAKDIFGTVNVIGKTLRLNYRYDMVVAGVLKDLPKDLSFNAELFISSANSPKQRVNYKEASISSDGKSNSKYKFPFNVFIELDKNADVAGVERRISSLHTIDDYLYPKNAILTPLKTNYFNTNYNDSDLLHGNANLFVLLSITGAIILLLAIINFVNLTTASYGHRLTEFGVRKCLGADRKSLITQFIAESFFTTVISSLIGILLAGIFLPYFNKYVEKTLALQFFSDFHFLTLFAGFVLILSVIIGFFPALVLSKISPLQLFKLNPASTSNGGGFRNTLTIFQFSMAIILIAGLIVISKQIDFVKHKDIGFNTDKLLYLKIHYALNDRVQGLTDKLRQYHGMKSLTKTFGIPGEVHMISNGYSTISIDSATMETFGFRLIRGRNLMPSDNNRAVLINETALKQLKGKDWKNERINGCEIAGVVSDFNYSSLHTAIGPFMLWYAGGIEPNTITMRISGPIRDAVDYINRSWKEIFPDYPIQLNFFDEHFASMYRKEENLASLATIFSLLAAVISGMGIFGLSVFQSERRIKEIGIRKVLGASVVEIAFLLAQGFIRWVILANIIAAPIAYYFMEKWLQHFAYRTDMSWWIFALSGGIALAIALTTVSFQAIKAATANPVKALRYE